MHRRQLQALGVSKQQVWRWVQAGRLHPQYPGVYAVGHTVLSEKGHLIAALFYAGRGAALSHGSGAAWWKLITEAPAEIHVSVPTRRRPVDGIVLHHPRRLERVFHHELPVTPIAQTLLDFAAGATQREVRKALAEADYRGLLDIDAVESVTGHGRPGSTKLRRALRIHLPELARTVNGFEDEFLLLCEREGLPIPVPNAWVCGFRVDAFWPQHRLIVELDGREGHSSPAQRLRDHERDLRLRSRGYIVLRYTWHQVVSRPKEVVADLRAALNLS